MRILKCCLCQAKGISSSMCERRLLRFLDCQCLDVEVSFCFGNIKRARGGGGGGCINAGGRGALN
jgi:hypothetical protein